VVNAESRVETRNVNIERITDDFVVLSGGLRAGDRVVTSGLEKLRTGSVVRIIEGRP
jgi:multidrug efflux pump subunit AcrA (membrane-fusion protein)